jgi:hypothetical protein
MRASLALAILSTAITTALPGFAQPGPSSTIPDNAVVIERAPVPATVHPNRELLLWMISPVRHDRGALEENPYTCPEQTLGSYYSGPARLSLLDARSGRVINTIKLMSSISDDVDEFNIPYRILSGLYYLVPGVPKGSEGKPALLKLRDLNGDGIAAETAFFEAEACMGLPTTLIGYSVAKDRVIQYRAEIEVTEFEQNINGDRLGQRRRSGKPKVEDQVWIDYLFSEKPVRPGHWKYKIDYSGRGGCDDSYDLRYNRARETFVGTLTELCQSPDQDPNTEK